MTHGAGFPHGKQIDPELTIARRAVAELERERDKSRRLADWADTVTANYYGVILDLRAQVAELQREIDRREIDRDSIAADLARANQTIDMLYNERGRAQVREWQDPPGRDCPDCHRALHWAEFCGSCGWFAEPVKGPGLRAVVIAGGVSVEDSDSEQGEPEIENPFEMAPLRRTLGSLQWLDNLTDGQFALLEDEIWPIYVKARSARVKEVIPTDWHLDDSE